MSFEGKNLYGQYIDYSEKIMAQGLHLPLIQQISGERLQDHWSSGLIFAQNIDCGYTLEPPR